MAKDKLPVVDHKHLMLIEGTTQAKGKTCTHFICKVCRYFLLVEHGWFQNNSIPHRKAHK